MVGLFELLAQLTRCGNGVKRVPFRITLLPEMRFTSFSYQIHRLSPISMIVHKDFAINLCSYGDLKGGRYGSVYSFFLRGVEAEVGPLFLQHIHNYVCCFSDYDD